MRVVPAVVSGVAVMMFVAGCGDDGAVAPQKAEGASDPEPAPGKDAQRTSDQPATPEPPGSAASDHEFLTTKNSTENSCPSVEYCVATGATSEKDLAAIVVGLRAEDPAKDTATVGFHAPEGEPQEAGVRATRSPARRRHPAFLAYSESEIDGIM